MTAVTHSSLAASWQCIRVSVCVETQWNTVYNRQPNEGCALKAWHFPAPASHHAHELADGFQGLSSEKVPTDKMKGKSAFYPQK